MLSFLPILSLLPLFTSTLASSSYTCTSHQIPLSLPPTPISTISLSPPTNQSELVSIVTELFSSTSNSSELVNVTGGEVLEGKEYSIWGKVCTPDTDGWGEENTSVVEFAVHGINLDHFYWEIGGQGSGFNFIDSAIEAGHAVFVFDRLGTGKSSTPDGIREVQVAVEVAVLKELIGKLRDGSVGGYKFDKVVAVGHSYGSFILTSLVANYGNIVDGLVLTGFSTSIAAFPATFAGLGFGLASIINPTAFGSLSNDYTTPSNIVNLQQMFFHFPNFPPSNLDFISQHVGISTIGELLTIGQSLAVPATNYTGPLLIVTGAKDFIVCGGNCFQTPPPSTSPSSTPNTTNSNFTNLIDPAHSSLFPSVSDFETFIQADAGHNHLAHFGADEALGRIQGWVGGRFG